MSADAFDGVVLPAGYAGGEWFCPECLLEHHTDAEPIPPGNVGTPKIDSDRIEDSPGHFQDVVPIHGRYCNDHDETVFCVHHAMKTSLGAGWLIVNLRCDRDRTVVAATMARALKGRPFERPRSELSEHELQNAHILGIDVTDDEDDDDGDNDEPAGPPTAPIEPLKNPPASVVWDDPPESRPEWVEEFDFSRKVRGDMAYHACFADECDRRGWFYISNDSMSAFTCGECQPSL